VTTESSEKPKVHFGTISWVDGIGYYIQPDGQPNAVVNFPGNYKALPASYEIGDKVTFTLDSDGISALSINHAPENPQ